MRTQISPGGATRLAAVSDLALAAVKLQVGTKCASPVLVADAKHSVLDAVVDVGLQTTISTGPAAQSALAAGVAIMIAGVGVQLLQAARAMPTPTSRLLSRSVAFATAVQLAALAVKVGLCRLLRASARRHPADATVLTAAFQHHRTDVFVSGGALCGSLLGGLGWRLAERATVVGIAVLLFKSAYELADLALSTVAPAEDPRCTPTDVVG